MSKFEPRIISLENQNKAADRTVIVSYEYPLYFLIEIKHPEAPANALAYRLLQTIKEKYEEGKLSPCQNFEEALKETNEILGKLVDEGDTDWIGNLSATVALFDHETINVASIGNISCFLIREKNITEITEEQEQTTRPAKTFSNILSGELKENDKIVFGNHDFLEHLSLNFLRQTLINHPAKEAALHLVNSLQREKIKTASALLFEIKNPSSEIKIDKPKVIYIDENKTKKLVDSSKKTFAKLSLKIPRLPKIKIKKSIFIVLALTIGIILSYFIFIAVKSHSDNKNQDQQKIIMQAEDKKRAGDETFRAGNKAGAESLYKEAISIAQTVNSKDSKNLIDKINIALDQMNSIVRVAVKEILDLSFLKEPQVSQIFIVGKNIYYVDNKSNQLYQEKDSKAQLPQSAGAFISGIYQPQENIIILNLASLGIFEYKIDEGTLNKADILFENKWEKAKMLATYFTNLYLLNTDDGQIYKHEKTAAGYSKAIPYVDKNKVNLKNTISITLDGYLYALNSNGSILKLMAGKPVADFALKGIPETDTTIKNPLKIMTSVDSAKLYILADNNIVELDKNGNYNKTYIVSGITKITDVVLSQKNKKIYLLSDNKVYEMGI